MEDLTEEALRQIVSGTSNDWMAALKEKHPDWILQAIQSQPASSETGEQAGPIEGYTFYDPSKISTSDKFQRYDVSGKLLGSQQFKKPGSAWDLTKQAAADLGPILQFTPLAPLVRAVSALSAAERGDILGALAAGLPIADKIPGLDAATASTLKDIGKYASVGKAAQSGDWQQVLSAASQIPGIGANIPQELKTVSDYASKAALLQRAAKGDIGALTKLAKEYGGATPSPSETTGGYGGAETSGFYDAEEEQNFDDLMASLAPTSEPLPQGNEDIDALLSEYAGTGADTAATPTFTPGSDDVYEDIESLLARYEGQGFADQPSGATDQSVDITGSKDVIIPDWDVLPDVVTSPRSIRDIGTVTKIGPDEKLEGTEIKEKDLAEDLKPVTTGGAKTSTTKTTDKKNEIDWSKLFALLGAMNRPQEQKEQYQTATGIPDYEDLMYGLRSGETPYMRG